MAFLHNQFNDSTNHGRLKRQVLQNLENGHEGLDDLVATMAMMIDGDGSSSAHFTEVTTRFGYVDNASAKAAYDELQSLASKFNTDGSVANVHAALQQAFNKFR